MRRFGTSVSALAFGLALAATPVHAQKFFVAGGATLPSGDFGEAYKAGWVANAGLSLWSSSNGRASLWVEGLYGQNKADADVEDVKMTNLAGLGSITYNLTTGSTAPYLIGSVGYLSQKFSDGDDSESEGGVAFGGGAGVGFGKAYIEGRYLTASIVEGYKASFLMVVVGVTF